MPIRPENRHRYPTDWPQISLRIRTIRAAGQCECLGECRRGTHTGRCPNRHGQPAYGTGAIQRLQQLYDQISAGTPLSGIRIE